MTDEVRREWAKRADALGRAQSRLLWIGLVVGLFFFSLAESSQGGTTAKVPLLGIAICGSLLAWGDAMKEYGGTEWREHAGRLDMYPTVFDLAHYTTIKSKVVSADESILAELISYFLFYPTFLSLLLFESAAFLVDTLLAPASGAVVFLILGVPFWLWAQHLVGRVWNQRIIDVQGKLAERRKERELLAGPTE
jgi:protein-S-isoprenylcysteine O-methyltransferase Ste14